MLRAVPRPATSTDDGYAESAPRVSERWDRVRELAGHLARAPGVQPRLLRKRLLWRLLAGAIMQARRVMIQTQRQHLVSHESVGSSAPFVRVVVEAHFTGVEEEGGASYVHGQRNAELELAVYSFSRGSSAEEPADGLEARTVLVNDERV